MVLCGFFVITWGQREHGFGAPGALRGQSLHPRLGEGILEKLDSMHLPEDELQCFRKCSSHSSRSKSGPVAL